MEVVISLNTFISQSRAVYSWSSRWGSLSSPTLRRHTSNWETHEDTVNQHPNTGQKRYPAQGVTEAMAWQFGFKLSALLQSQAPTATRDLQSE